MLGENFRVSLHSVAPSKTPTANNPKAELSYSATALSEIQTKEAQNHENPCISSPSPTMHTQNTIQYDITFDLFRPNDVSKSS
jgi:hypothetical protein